MESFFVLRSFLPGALKGVKRPLRFLQQTLGGNGAANGVDHPRIWSTKTAGDIPAVFLQFAIDVDDFKVACLLKGGDEVLRDELANFWFRKGTCPKFLGIVSREFFASEVARHQDHEHQFALLLGKLCRLLWILRPLDHRAQLAVCSARSCRLLWFQ